MSVKVLCVVTQNSLGHILIIAIPLNDMIHF